MNIAHHLPYSADRTWLTHLEYVLESGIKSSPRGQPIIECLATTAVVNMTAPVITNLGRKMSYKFMTGEAWWIASGHNDTESIGRYNKRILDFSDDGQTFFGAYGPKAQPQMDYVIDKLMEDHDSRQAVINIWRENPPQSKDIPCTTSVQWLIRGGELHCVDHMRSNDLWLGFVYDIFNFSMLSALVAIRLRQRGLKVGMGLLHLSAGSSHIYERDYQNVQLCFKQVGRAFDYEPFNVDEFDSEEALLGHLKKLADRDFVNLKHRWLQELAHLPNGAQSAITT